MNRRNWGAGSILLLGCLFSLGLVFYFLVSEGRDVQAAAPHSVDIRQDWDEIYLPLLFNKWNYDEYGYGGGNGNGNGSGDSYKLKPEELKLSSLDVGETEYWTMDLTAGDKIMLTTAPGSTADIILSFQDSKGSILVDEQNFAPGGEVETIQGITIDQSGEYELLVRTEQGAATDYAVALLDAEEHTLVFRGVLFDNDSREDKFALSDPDLYWFFSAEKDDKISITVKPKNNGDAYFALYGPDSQLLEIIDKGVEGTAESLQNYTVTAGGMFAVSVAEFYKNPMDYTISFSKK